ncbi:hypothetical protein CEXT_731491 [Caerostris extrusa]|uniref:Uncharacterized protein n=1 Tax=Caerostris extrusa TaxID=172846 RepID=A0AAV4SPI7_CAEEX|nr:hypothetical protein CEXT_731491 [Caerostris extrusa]
MPKKLYPKVVEIQEQKTTISATTEFRGTPTVKNQQRLKKDENTYAEDNQTQKHHNQVPDTSSIKLTTIEKVENASIEEHSTQTTSKPLYYETTALPLDAADTFEEKDHAEETIPPKVVEIQEQKTTISATTETPKTSKPLYYETTSLPLNAEENIHIKEITSPEVIAVNGRKPTITETTEVPSTSSVKPTITEIGEIVSDENYSTQKTSQSSYYETTSTSPNAPDTHDHINDITPPNVVEIKNKNQLFLQQQKFQIFHL